MSRTSKLNIIAALVAMALVSAMVVRGSSSAFSGSTDNSNNSWTAGTVALSDDDSGSALFTPGNLRPGDSETNCIQVSYDGTLDPPTPVTLAVTGLVDGGLGDDLVLTVVMGAPGDDCLDPAAGTTIYNAVDLSAATQQDTWTPVVGSDVMRPFHFTVTLDAATPNTEQGADAQAAFTWSATS